MGLQRDTFTVYLTDPEDPEGEPRELTATISHQDMLRGEQALLGTPGMNLAHGLALTTAWCWASLMRQGDYANSWQAFRDLECQGVEKAEPTDVDPTTAVTPGASV